MPLQWTIDPQQMFVTIVADGNVERADFDALLGALNEADAFGYRKLFDGERVETRMKPEDFVAIGARIRLEHAKRPMGPLALVLPEEFADRSSSLLGVLASADRSTNAFEDVSLARRWLRRQSVPAANP